jgi:hypothetical protein
MSRIPPNRLVAPLPAAGRERSRHAVRFAACLARSLIAVAIAGCVPAVPGAPTPTPATPATATPIESATGAAPRTADAATPEATPAAPAPSSSPGQTLSASATPPTPTGAPARPELLLLAYDGDAAELYLVRLSGDVVPLPLPDPSVAAVAPTAGGQLVAVLRDGRAFVALRGPAGLVAGTGWRALALTGSGAMPPGAIVWSATSSPDGTRLAAIARPRDAESPSALIITEPGRGRRDIRPLADESEGVAPAWIDDARVAIVQRDRFDQLFLALVAVATGRVADRLPLRALDFGTSRDARTSVVLTGDRIVVGPTASVLEMRRAPDTGPAMPPGDFVKGGIALSGDGRYLAVAIEEGDPGPSRIAIYERVGGAWRAAIRITPPASASGGWLMWLP